MLGVTAPQHGHRRREMSPNDLSDAFVVHQEPAGFIALDAQDPE